jgi:hypothetical protein
MRVEGYIFAFVATFLAVSDAVYWFTSHDPTGTTALALACGLSTIIATFSLVTARRIPPRYEDRADADIEEGAGEIGFFSPHSWWPLWTALGAALVAVGWIFGWWLFLVGVGALIGGASGFILEYYVSPYHDV